MPKPGFLSVTISELVYQKLFLSYTKRKKDLTLQGINSFSSYLTNTLYKAVLEKKSNRRKKK